MMAERFYSRWLIWLVLATVPVLVLAQSALFKDVYHEGWTDQYDRHFKKYSKHYFGAGFDWRWFKAQAIAESRLEPDAVSPNGALGLMQVLPSTYREVKEKNPHFRNIEDPRWNIAAGIYYNRQLFRRWTPYIQGEERLRFAMASYNAGFSATRKAYREAKKQHKRVQRWSQVEAHAPGETRHYVRRIDRLMQNEKVDSLQITEKLSRKRG